MTAMRERYRDFLENEEARFRRLAAQVRADGYAAGAAALEHMAEEARAMRERGLSTNLPSPGAAANIDVSSCEHSVHLDLLDRSGRRFASASIPLEGAADFVDSVLEKAEKAIKARAAGGKCQGHA
jgi:hypothetical protein